MSKAEQNGPEKLTCRISGTEDIVNRLSTEGFELLSPAFLSFIGLMCPEGSGAAPALLEITGAVPDAEGRKIVRGAVRLHYRLRAARLARELKACRARILWFLLCTALSSAFLYAVTKQTSEVATQFFYLPVWFFGYRLITYPLQEYLPLRRELRRCRRLAAMRLRFAGEPAPDTEAPADDAPDEALTRNFTKEDGTVLLGCRAASPDELLNPRSAPGNELISDELAASLAQAEPFVDPEKPAELLVSGCAFSEKEKNTLAAALRNYEALRLRQAEGELKGLCRNIAAYALGLAAFSAALCFCGKSAGLALHELFLIGLWFFGDYLVEFILIGLSGARYTLRLRRRLLQMKLRFESGNSAPNDQSKERNLL